MLHMSFVEPVTQSSTLEKPSLRTQCESCLDLTSQINEIATEIESLVSERDRLSSSLTDLKQILKRVAKENADVAAKHVSVNKALKEKLEKSRLSIQTAEKCSGHFSRMALYWSQLN